MSVRQQTTNAPVPVSQLYRKLEIVGKGAYGAVYRGQHVPTGQIVALKIIDLDTPDDDVADIQREVSLLSQLRAENNNITKYYGCWLEGPKVWIVMDFASGGSVRTLMKSLPNGILEERWIAVVVRELLVALVYLHKSNVIHRDIKAANILIQSTGKVVLCDFGVSAFLSTSYAKRTTFIGTPHYMAPEVLTSSAYDSKADIWSLGITLYEMATGAQPLAEIPQVQAITLIPKVKPPKLAEHYGSKEMRDFLSYCLRELPSDRQAAEELAKAKWIKNSSKLPVATLKNMLLRYDKWAQAGGIRQSLADPAPWEVENARSELEGAPDRSSWEFDTIKARHNSFHSGEQSDNNEPVHTSLSHRLPESLRMLFDDGSFSPSSSEPDFLHKFAANFDDQSLQQSISSTSLPDISLDEGSDVTARLPRHRVRTQLAFKTRQQGPSSADEKSDEYRKASQSDVENLSKDYHQGTSSQVLISHSDSETHARSGHAHTSHTNGDLLPTLRKNPAPLDFRFPRSGPRDPPVNRGNPSLDAAQASSPSHTVTHNITASLDSSRNHTKYGPPSHTNHPSAGSSASQLSRNPSLQRQMSVAVMENLQERRLPLQEASLTPGAVGTRDNIAPGPKSNVSLKDALKLPPLPLDSSLSLDILPPSPSIHASLVSRYFPVGPMTRGPATLSPASPLAGDRLAFSDPHPPNQQTISPSPTPYSSQSLPLISPLDFSSLLCSREDTHAQLARTVEDLAVCLQVVERGLDALLRGSFSGIAEEGREELEHSQSEAE